MDTFVRIAAAIWWTLGEMAPYLLLGFVVAGLLSAVVSRPWVERHLGGRGLVSVIKATLLGVPLPLCSCGVIPVAASLRQQGASKGAVTSFLISTPQTGVDSIFATYGLLGLPIAILRPLVALISGIVGGAIVDRLEPGLAATDRSEPSGARVGDACRGVSDTDSTRGSRWRDALRHGAITLPNDIALPLVVGIVLAGIITAVAEPRALEPYLGGWKGMLIMLAMGIPVYVCSTGSIPLALGFIHLGASPGAAVVFLVAGPATNAATLAVNWKVLGRRAAVAYLVTVVAASLGAGLMLDLVLTPWLGSVLPHMPEHDHAHPQGAWKQVCAAALLVLLAVAVVRSRFGGRQAAAGDRAAAGPPARVLTVEGMTCSHCAATVAQAIREQPGVTDANVELTSGRASVWGDHLDSAALTRAVEKLGYKVRAT